MNRSPSTAIKHTPDNSVPAFPRDRAVLAEVFTAVREAYPSVEGLTHVSADRAFFQIFADPTHYSVAITADEAATLGYLSL